MRDSQYYVISTEKGCTLSPGNHRKTTETLRVGFANDKLRVTCECGGEWIALTYAKGNRK